MKRVEFSRFDQLEPAKNLESIEEIVRTNLLKRCKIKKEPDMNVDC